MFSSTKEKEWKDQLEKFKENADQTDLPFPPTLSQQERKQLHCLAESLGLSSYSSGTGINRFLNVTKNKDTSRDTLSFAARKKLAHDYSLPIELTEYWGYFVELYDELFHVKRKIQYLTDAISNCGSESAFWEHYQQVKDKIIAHVKSKENYSSLSKSVGESLHKNQMELPGKSTLFEPENHEKYFISLDLITANFFSLRNADKSLVDDCDSWKEFCSKFTPYEYIINSKYFRQIVFGNLNGKTQQALEKRIMIDIYKEIQATKYFSKEDFKSLTNDEIIIELSFDKLSEARNLIIDVLQGSEKLAKISKDVRLEVFKLIHLEPEPFYVKEILSCNDGANWKKESFSIKCVPPFFFAQAYKRYTNKPINQIDLKFIHHGRVATFDVPLYRS